MITKLKLARCSKKPEQRALALALGFSVSRGEKLPGLDGDRYFNGVSINLGLWFIVLRLECRLGEYHSPGKLLKLNPKLLE